MSNTRHPPLTIFLHWAGALMVVIAAALVFGRELADTRAVSRAMLGWHREAGLVVMGLTLWRLSRIARHKDPEPGVIGWMSKAPHFAFYLLLIAVPVLGWVQTSAAGRPVTLLGLALPALTGRDRDLAETLEEWHEDIAWALFALVAVHILAALWHHFVKRDSTLTDMLPARGR